MKSILKKILFSVLVITILIFIAEKLFIKDEVIEVSENENNIQQNGLNNEVSKEAYNVLAIGNSLTLERDGIGMAASDQYHDYYYLTKTRLEEKYKNVNMKRVSCIHWEENRIIRSRTDWIKDNLREDLIKDQDLVIFQLGDNCVPTETFEDSVTELVNHVKNYSPNAKMLLVGMWFTNEERLNLMPQIAEKLEMKFVDISDLVVDENKSYIGAEITAIDGKKDTISTVEEAFHPNDEGMKKISDRICEELGI